MRKFDFIGFLGSKNRGFFRKLCKNFNMFYLCNTLILTSKIGHAHLERHSKILKEKPKNLHLFGLLYLFVCHNSNNAALC